VLITALSLLLFLFRGISVAQGYSAKEDLSDKRLFIQQVSVSSVSFSPSRNQSVELNYNLLGDAAVTVRVFDPDSRLVRALCDNSRRRSGRNREIWDGKDSAGSIVPDETYVFVIEAASKQGGKAVYDPTTFSGGDEFDITSASINRESNTVTYQLPYPARVLIRIGIAGGPLLKTLVDWKPRVSGEITEYWNGMDEDDLLNVRDHREFKMIVTGFRLPENSVITYGNGSIDYAGYESSLGGKRPLKENRAIDDRPNTIISSHYGLSRVFDRSPRIVMSFPEVERSDPSSVVVLKGKALVRVEMDQAYTKLFADQQFEVSFYLDGVYYSEEEVGYTPYNWLWDLSNVAEGEHILTVNVSSFKDQIGIASKKVRVVK